LPRIRHAHQPAAAPRRDTLNLLIPAAERNLIDCLAEETLLDQAGLSVGPEAYAEFLGCAHGPE
jgi:hypothetical protein